MAGGDMVSCRDFKNFLVSQEPVYDKMVLKDFRPAMAGLAGFYQTGTFDAYDGVEHSFDRFKSVFPDVTKPWSNTVGGMTPEGVATDCQGNPCDPHGNKIGWGWIRNKYHLEQQSWETGLICFDDTMTRTRAKEHFTQIIRDILKPASNFVMQYYLQRKAFELSGKKFCVTTGMPEFTFTWDSGGYVYLNTSADPTGRLTPDILQSRVQPQYFVGAIDAGQDGFNSLQLHTDNDTFRYLARQDPTLLNAWRFGDFSPAAKEFYKYGFRGYVGDFMVKTLQFPLRFNKVSAGRYQLVLPYKNSTAYATEGIGSDFNPDYDKAQYQISYVNNPKALRVLPFRPGALNDAMPFLVRDYAGQWKFATNDLGADCNGRPIDNSRGNKGKFLSDFRLAVKPEYPEFLEVFFHKRDRPYIHIIDVSNSDPGYPTQTYACTNASCDQVLLFTAAAKADTTYAIAANSIRINGNVLTHSAISGATLALFVADLQTKWAAATPNQTGTWAVYDSSTLEISLTGGPTGTVDLPFTLA